MRHSRRLHLSVIGIAVLTLGLFLGGCGVTSAAGTAQATLSSATIPSPTVSAPATISPDELEVAGCPPDGALGTPFVTAGAFKASIPTRVLDYPSERLPDTVSKGPYQLAASAVSHFAPNPPVNPPLSPGYGFQICNTTSTSHTLTSITVTIVRFTPSSGPVNIWHLCSDGPYDTTTKRTTTGCGGGFGGMGLLVARLPSDSAGASAPATASTQFQMGGMNLPATIGPDKSLELAVAVSGLSSQGTYELSFGLSVDGAAPSEVTPAGGPFLIAPSATLWTGTACVTPAMQAQIPGSRQDTYYVCPPAL